MTCSCRRKNEGWGVVGEKMSGRGGHFFSLLGALGLPRVIPGDEVIQREKTMKFLDPPLIFSWC